MVYIHRLERWFCRFDSCQRYCKNAGVSRCGNGVRLICGLVYPFAGSSPATGTKINQDGEMVNAQSSNLCTERFVGSSPTLGTNYTSFGPT